METAKASEDAVRILEEAGGLILRRLNELEQEYGRWYAIQVLILLNEMKEIQHGKA